MIDTQSTSADTADWLLGHFAGRTDAYAFQYHQGTYEARRSPLDAALVQRHLNGEITLGAYQTDAAGLSRAFCIDIDSDGSDAGISRAREFALDLAAEAAVPLTIEFSGAKGWHVWGVLVEPVAWERANAAAQGLLAAVGGSGSQSKFSHPQTGLRGDIYPQGLGGGGLGKLVKLPLGVHRKSGARSYFIRSDGEPMEGPPDVTLIASAQLPEGSGLTVPTAPEAVHVREWDGGLLPWEPWMSQVAAWGFAQGFRNRGLFLVASWLITRSGLEPADIVRFVGECASRCSPPLEAREVSQIIRSASRRLTLPPIMEQRRIASVITALDDKVDSNRHLARLLEEATTTLFRAKFVDFVGNFDFVESEIGPIPRGWRVDSIYSAAKVTYGAPFKSALFDTQDGVPLIRIRDLGKDEPAVRTTEQRRGARLINPGDIVVGMDGEFRAYLWHGEHSWLNQRVCAFDPLPGVSRAFVLEAIRRPLAFYEATKGGTTVIHLGRGDIDRFRVCMPEESAMRSFAAEADPMLDLAVSLRGECRSLGALRDALLPKLVTGQIRVPAMADPQETVGAAAQAKTG